VAALAVSALASLPEPTAQVKTGDAYDLVLELEPASVDLVVTSPPYWGLRSYGLDHRNDVLGQWEEQGCDRLRVPPYDWYREAGGLLGLEPYPHWYVSHLVEFFGRLKAKLKQTGSLWVNLGDTYFARWSSIREGGRQGLVKERSRRRTPSGGLLIDKQLLMIPARFAIAMQDAGWIVRNDLIWAKSRVIPGPERDRLRLSHEHWFHLVRRSSTGRASYYYNVKECEEGLRDVVSCAPSTGGDGHSATFPGQLVRPRIASSCAPNGMVVDPFCGTGTTMVEAVRLGRRAIGFELSSAHALTARTEVRRAIRHQQKQSDGLGRTRIV
jgi:DNA modification methylase